MSKSEDKAKRVAIITFHGAHNYGAVIQAYALQKFLIENQYECEIIDFRSKSQRDFNSLYPHRNGIKSIIKNLLMLRYDKKRRRRDNRFERFLINNLVLSDSTITEEAKLDCLSNDYDIYITGSDQVWNVTKKADTSKAYFLNFVGNEKKKIAYAVSLGNAKEKDLISYEELINGIDYISTREVNAARIISKITKRDVPNVLDPTLLVNQNVLLDLTKDQGVPANGEYLFYYSLDGYDKRTKNTEELLALSKRLNLKILSVTPEWPKNTNGIIDVIDAGPCEFLNLIKNAAIVCTNSFHGTALSILFNKEFYVLDEQNESDTRKTDVLSLLGLEDRMVEGRDIVSTMPITKIDYVKVNKRLEELRNHSKNFLLEAMND